MSKGGGKGRVSNELVAASCAAVLAVYAAGYWRTREAADRLEARAQVRRPTRAPAPPPEAEVAPVAGTAPAEEPAPVAGTASVEDTVPAPAPMAPPMPAAVPAEATKPVPAPVAPPATVAEATAPPPAILSVPLPAELPAPAPEARAPSDDAWIDDLPKPADQWKDGIYSGWGYSNHGDIEAEVVIKRGHIVSSRISECLTRYPCDVIETILKQPVWRQSPDVDNVSRATESADAYYYAVSEALKKALVDEAPAAAAAPASAAPSP